MFIWTTEREKQVFPELKIPATLAAGEMLLVTSLDHSGGTLGDHFFSDHKGDEPLRRLWVLRVAQAGPDRAFVDWQSNAAKPVDEVQPDSEDSRGVVTRKRHGRRR
jgi:hypothetical protein